MSSTQPIWSKRRPPPHRAHGRRYYGAGTNDSTNVWAAMTWSEGMEINQNINDEPDKESKTVNQKNVKQFDEDHYNENNEIEKKEEEKEMEKNQKKVVVNKDENNTFDGQLYLNTNGRTFVVPCKEYNPDNENESKQANVENKKKKRKKRKKNKKVDQANKVPRVATLAKTNVEKKSNENKEEKPRKRVNLAKLQANSEARKRKIQQRKKKRALQRHQELEEASKANQLVVSREKANTWVSSVSGKPPFADFGGNNTKPINGGMIYGDYMRSHNIAPLVPPNKAPSTYAAPAGVLKYLDTLSKDGQIQSLWGRNPHNTNQVDTSRPVQVAYHSNSSWQAPSNNNTVKNDEYFVELVTSPVNNIQSADHLKTLHQQWKTLNNESTSSLGWM